MNSADASATSARSSRQPSIVIFGVLFAFWTAIAVCVAAIVIDSAWDARDGDAARPPPATATALPALTATATASPAPTAATEDRPPGVPLTAAPLAGDFDTGEPEQHLFFNLACKDGVLAVITTDEHVFAETACPTSIDPVYLEPFLAEHVRITVSDGQLEIVSVEGARLTFPIGRAWIDQRRD